MQITDLAVKEIFDSRDESTIQVSLAADGGRKFLAAVPAGKSTGKNEARVFPFVRARAVLRRVRGKFLGKRFLTVQAFDQFLHLLDRTPDKRILGGNLSLGLSVAASRALAFAKDREPWEFLAREFFRGRKTGRRPLLFSNFINGGAHARNSLDIQEYLVVAKVTKSVTTTVKKLIVFYQAVGKYLQKRYHLRTVPIGDESGYALDFRSNYEPLKILDEQMRAAKLGAEFRLGLDAAASNFFTGETYRFENRHLTRAALLKIYLTYFQRCQSLWSLEDPFAEDDPAGFRGLLAKLPKTRWVVGDDLTTTNQSTIEDAANARLINAVIIKPNQIGTVSEAAAAIQAARARHLKVIVSHRSGETADDFIIHLAKASNADGVKLGAPLHERIYKYDELIRLYN